MASASIIDIGGIQWDVKDREARERVTSLEEKTSANFDYSLDEKEIGKWINGEKLYKLVIVGNATTSPYYINLQNKNIKEIIDIKGLHIPTNNIVYPFNVYMPYNSQELSKYMAILGFVNASKVLLMSFGNDPIYSNIKFTIQIEYTKNE